jgi:dTDP-4-dehydrorhamnose reductase
MKFLVLGASGMLGASLVPHLLAQGHAVTAHGRNSAGDVYADLTDAAAPTKLISDCLPDVVINLAGLTDVDRCQSFPQQAWWANVRVTENVATACAQSGCHLVQISSDQVYDGTPANAEDQSRPGNVYAITKYAGELAAKMTNATILRTNFFGASQHAVRRSLSDWLYKSLTQGQAIKVFDDVFFSPLSMQTLCQYIHQLAILRPIGTFNLGSREGKSKADFAFLFAQTLNLPMHLLTRISISQAQSLAAWRPRNMCLNNAKIESVLGQAMPTLAVEIELAANDYRATT